MNNLIRLSKLMSQKGICSRREAEKYIDLKQVMVDGKIIDKQGTKVSVDADIKLLSDAKKNQKDKVTIILHKPIGYVSCQPEKGYIEAKQLITKENQYKQKNDSQLQSFHLEKLSVVGRLDIESKGLLVFTQDGMVAKKIIGENSNIEKEYIVRVEGDVSKEKINKLSYGLYLDNKKLKKAKIDLLEPQVLRFILKEGKKRQIRRMCEQLGLKVTDLKRVRIGNIILGRLPKGKWRFLY